MSFYDAIKEAINLAQKADNIELYRQLLDLGAQALEMQNEIAQLKMENMELKRKADISKEIIRHDDPFLTLRGRPITERYCATCWGKDEKLIQVRRMYNGSFMCPLCNTTGVYDEKLADSDNAQEDMGGDYFSYRG